MSMVHQVLLRHTCIQKTSTTKSGGVTQYNDFVVFRVHNIELELPDSTDKSTPLMAKKCEVKTYNIIPESDYNRVCYSESRLYVVT